MKPGERVRDRAGRLAQAAFQSDGRAWLAWAALAAWIVLTGSRAFYTIPSTTVWFATQAAVGIGTLVARRTAPRAWPLFLVASALIAAAAAGLTFLVLPRLGQISGPHPLRLAAIVGSATLGAAAAGRTWRIEPRSRGLLVLGVIVWFAIVDAGVLHGQAFRDVRLYLAAGRRFLEGGDVYATTLLTNIPTDSSMLPFLYPPVTLPFFAALATLPQWLTLTGWLALSGIAAAAALRELGVRGRWIVVLLLWPPFFEGLYVGNVAVPSLLFLAIAPAVPAALPFNLLFKPQSAFSSLWLARTGRWRPLLVGVGSMAVLVIVTLPLVGARSWAAWLSGLQLYQASQAANHGLYVYALPHYVPYSWYLVIAGLAVAVALILGSGVRGLARLAIASVIASPLLFRHGFLALLPGLLWCDEIVLWLTLGLGTGALGWWVTVAVAIAATFRRGAASARPPDSLHPLGLAAEPWPSASRV